MVAPARPIGRPGDVVEPELPAAIGMAAEVGVEEAPNRHGGEDD